MQKTKFKLVAVSAIGLTSVVFAVSAVSAQEAMAVKPETVVAAQSAKMENKNVNAGQKNTDTVVATADTTLAATTDATDTATDNGNKDKSKGNKGQVTAQAHRSAVATFVQSLLAVADREGGIGQQVKVIAQQQNDAKDKVAEEITAVENRSSIKTFLLGSDYKNLGDLRSQMVMAKNQITQLARLAGKAENDQDKTELQTQIQTLQQEQTNIDNFITQNENKFSLFGWAVKLFQ
jgi:hypothetical protein